MGGNSQRCPSSNPQAVRSMLSLVVGGGARRGRTVDEQGVSLVAAGGQDLETCDAHRPLTPSSAAANSTGHTATSNVLDNR